MVTPGAERAAIQHLRATYPVSERRACRVVGAGRTMVRYHARVRRDDTPLRTRLRELARRRPRFGVRRLHVLLRREGLVVNHKRTERLYREEALAVGRRIRKRVAHQDRGRPQPPRHPNEQWALDFVSDALGSGRRIRCLNVVDTGTREALAIVVDTSLGGERVAHELDTLVRHRGVPREIVLDNGPELRSKALDRWASGLGIALRFIAPGKPIQNATCESFNGRFRDECLNQHWFLGLVDAQTIIEDWRQDDNHQRPHGALGYQTPDAVRRQLLTSGPSSSLDHILGAGQMYSHRAGMR
jgi:putative transposase